MKREIIPGRFILLILAAFLAIMVLPIVLASLSGQLDLPVEQSYAPDPKADWTIASVLPQEDGLLAPEMTGEGVTVPLAGLPAGEAETLQLLCRSQDGGPAEETQVTFQLLPQSDGTLTLRAYPEKADLLNVNFRYEYSPSA
mgnify:CR=1 FL=1